jgi:predicted metalloprotease with PDZ domain
MLLKNGVYMQANYIVLIDKPEHHHVKVTLKLTLPEGQKKLRVFLPSWSPGSYLMREYARHIRWFEATQQNGEVLFHQQISKNVWEIDWERSHLNKKLREFQVTYDIYCKELTVRTSHVDASHAFLHGPSYLMGVEGESLENPTIEFRFPSLWSKLSTGLKDISDERHVFLYTARDYDELIDSPVEIGCHETDGFMFNNVPHHLAQYGDLYPHTQNLKEDFQKVVATVAQHFDNDLPYDHYLFITHFVPKLYGGLEHLNSTALQFDGRKLQNRRDYLTYLSLVGHEYFHLWNVKRIRPHELGPFDYVNENYTSMLWLAEGLTSFMDDLFVYRAGVAKLEEYLDFVKTNLENFHNTPGRHYHSLEQSSFNAWVKLYRPDENSKNSSVSYYLKGGLVFMVLHAMLLKKGSSIDDLIKLLWQDFKSRPESGVTKDHVYKMVSELGGEETLEKFSTMIETTSVIDFDSCMKEMGCEIRYTDSKLPWIGVDWDFQADRVMVKSVVIDSPAHKAGLNAGDEVLFMNGLRFLRDEAEKMSMLLLVDKHYDLVISRLGRLTHLSVTPSYAPRQIKEIAVVDRELAEKSFHFPRLKKPKPA